MDENNVWKIEKAGLYCFGHAGSTFINVEISRPGAGWSFHLRLDKANEFLVSQGLEPITPHWGEDREPTEPQQRLFL